MIETKYFCDWCTKETVTIWEMTFEQLTGFAQPKPFLQVCSECAHKVYKAIELAKDECTVEPVDYNALVGDNTVLKVVPAPVDWGHGHVYPRKDGALARCGGPALCSQCARDLARLNAAQGKRKVKDIPQA